MIQNDLQLSRKEREEEFRRNLVLDAAEGLFAEKGFDGTTVSDIAVRSELAKGSLYHLFQSKEEIISAILKRKLEGVWEKLNRTINEPDLTPLQKIRGIMGHKIREFWESRQFAKIYLHELRAFHGPPRIPMIDEFHEQFTQIKNKTRALVGQAQEAGELRSDIPTDTLFDAFTGMTNGMILTWIDLPEELDVDASIEQAFDLYLNGAGVKK